jgi:hypothetical protein
MIGRHVSQGRRDESDSRLKQSSAVAGSGSRGTRPSQTRSQQKRKDTAPSGGLESSRKRMKSLPTGTGAVGSSGSALTTVSAGPLSTAEPQEDYERFALIQRNF